MASIFLLAILASSQLSISDDLRNEIYRYVLSAEVTLNDDDINDTIDLGFVTQNGTIGDFVWWDENENGIQDGKEKGLSDVNISLYNYETGNFINSTISNETGYYTFEVPYGRYEVTAGEDQKTKNYTDGCIKLHGNPCEWCPTDVGIGDPEKDSNDHNHTLVILDRDNWKNMTVDFGYVIRC